MFVNTIKQYQAFILVLLLAIGLRITGITFDSLWLDESYQSLTEAYAEKLPDLTNLNGDYILVKHQRVSDYITLIKNFRLVDPLCPPLYAVVLNTWVDYFGGSDLSVRLLSTVFSIIGIIVLFGLSILLFNYPIALLASLLMAISPFDISYAQEARMYTLTFLLSCLSGGLLFLLIKSIVLKSVNAKIKILFLLIFVLATVALINTHYTNLLFVGFEILYVLYFIFRTKNKELFFFFCLSGALMLIIWLPWFNLFLEALHAPHQVFYVTRKATFWWPIYALLVRLPLNFILFLSGKKIILPCILLYGSAAVILLFSLKGLFVKNANDKMLNFSNSQEFKRLTVEYLWLWLLVPSLLLWGLDIVKNQKLIEISRYSYAIAPSAFILGGIGLYNLSRHYLKLFKSVILIQIIFCLINTSYTHIIPQKEPWQSLANDLSKYNPKDYFVFVSQFYDIVCLDRYLTRPYRQIGLSPAMEVKQIENIFIKFKPVKFILITAQEGEAIKNMLPHNFKMTRQINYFHGLHLREYVRF